MKRRQFLQASAAASGLLSVPLLADDAERASSEREFFELRSYTLMPGKRERLDAYFQEGLLPALQRLKAPPAGVFYETPEAEAPVVWLLLRHPDAAGAASLPDRLAADPVYMAAAEKHLSGPTADAVYDRIDSSLLVGIDGMPRLNPPPLKPRMFNLRIYESFNERTLRKKIEMFNEGELAIFRRVGLTPVFFSRALTGSRLPNLTYLLAFDDDAARQTAWNTFRGDSEWQKLKAIPEYQDQRLVARITNLLLTPAEYSQI
jgi:hypothetical protein